METKNPIVIANLMSSSYTKCLTPVAADLLQGYQACILKNLYALHHLPNREQICAHIQSIQEIFSKQANALHERNHDIPFAELTIHNDFASLQSLLVDLSRDIQDAPVDTMLQDILDTALNRFDDYEDMINHIGALELFHIWFHEITE